MIKAVRIIFRYFIIVFALKCANHSLVSASSERVVTAEQLFQSGVPVDYSYNESDFSSFSSSNDLQSVPGCPKSVNGLPWIYYGAPPSEKCYLVGRKGPCYTDQLLFMENASQYGICNCDCFEGMEIASGEIAICKTFAFMPQEKQCYKLYTQGPCKKESEWLAKMTDTNNKTTAVCENRRCPEGKKPLFSLLNNGEFTGCIGDSSAFLGLLVNKPIYSPRNSCNDGFRYSSVLRTCVKKTVKNFTIG